MSEMGEPKDAIKVNLEEVDRLRKLPGKQDYITVAEMASMGAWAQVAATCALVHAVRELTEVLRKGRE